MKEDLFDYAQYLLKLAVKKTDNFDGKSLDKIDSSVYPI